MWPAMIDMPTARHFSPEAEANFRPIPPAEPGDIRRRLAGILLQYAGSGKARRPGISQREMTVILDTSWDTVSSSLKSLQAEGAIRIDRHRIVINKKALERIAVETMKTRAYALLRARNGDSEQAVAIVQCQPGVVMVDRVEGLADVIFAVQAPDRESLATLMVRAMAAVEDLTEDIQLLPAKNETTPG